MKRATNRYKQQINQILKSLTPGNRAYFDKLEQYMVYASLTHDENKLYEQIYAMVRDLQESEKDGLTAEDFFGTQPKDMADELLANHPRQPIARLMQVLGVVISMQLFLEFFKTGALRLDIIKLLTQSVLFVLGFVAIYAWNKRRMYRESRKQRNRKMALYAFIFGALMHRIEPNLVFQGPVWHLPFPLDSLLLLALIVYLLYKIWNLPSLRLMPLAPLSLWLAGLFEQWQSRGVDVGVLSSYWFKSLMALSVVAAVGIAVARKQRQERGLD